MASLLDTVAAFFEQDQWPFRRVEDPALVQTQFQGENGQWFCFAQAKDSVGQLVFYSICPVKAPKDKNTALAEFLTRVNFGLLMGNFEMDFEDGQIRFKTSLDVEGDRLTEALVKNLVYANVFVTDQYLPGILKAIYSDTSPAAILAEIEGS